ATVIREGKSGADFLEETLADPRFLPYLEPVRYPWVGGTLRAREMPPPRQGLEYYPPIFEPEAGADVDLLPSWRRYRLSFDPPSSRFKLLDRERGVERWGVRVSFAQPSSFSYGMLGPSETGVPHRVQVRGHLAVICLGRMACGLDLLGRRVLWTRDLLEG